MNIGEKIRTLREQLNIDQKEFAKRTGIGQSSLSEIEGNKRQSIRSDILLKIAITLNVSADYLLGLTDNPLNENNEMPDFIKNKLNKLENLESQNLPDKLEKIAKELLDLSKKLKNL